MQFLHVGTICTTPPNNKIKGNKSIQTHLLPESYRNNGMTVMCNQLNGKKINNNDNNNNTKKK